MYDELDTNNDKSVFTPAPLLTLTNPPPQTPTPLLIMYLLSKK